MSNQLDLNRLRETIVRNQQHGTALPERSEDQVFVERGNIVLSENVPTWKKRELAQVHQGVWAASHLYSLDECEVVSRVFPYDTEPVTQDGVQGWQYTVTCEFGHTYILFIYHDGSAYQVCVAFPEVAGKYGVHDAHLYSDGRICFGWGYGGGLPSFEQAYAKSVVWCTGFSTFLATGTFPFSTNN
jgi:hypothetical protein